MVEVVLIQKDRQGRYSNYNNQKIIRWPSPLGTRTGGISCLSRQALAFKRSVHTYLFPEDKARD